MKPKNNCDTVRTLKLIKLCFQRFIAHNFMYKVMIKIEKKIGKKIIDFKI